MKENEISLSLKLDFDRARHYWDAFWKHEIIDRPCTIVIAKTKENAAPYPRLQAVDDDFSGMLSRFQDFLDTHSFLGEYIPGFRPGFGPDQMAGFLGAPLVVNPDSKETSWSEKNVNNWQEVLPLQLKTDNHCWQRMLEFHKFAQEYCEGKCLLYNIDLHSNIDTLEAMRGAEKLLYDLLDTPELILDAMTQIIPVYRQVYDELFQFGDKQKIGSNSCMHLYSRGKTDYIQADYIALLSPDMMRKFVLPAIENEAQFLDNVAFHLDGPDALKHIDDILAIDEIDLIQWQPGAGKPPAFEWPEVIDKIQAAGKAAILYGTSEQIKSIHGRYKSELIVYEVWADSQDQGNELLDWLAKHT